MVSSVSDEDVLAIWEAYEAGQDSPATLAARFGISLSALRRLAADHGWTRPASCGSARPVSWVNKPCPGLAECPERSELVAQSWVLAQQQIDEIEISFAGLDEDDDHVPGRKRQGPVHHARALGVVVRVLKDLVALDRATRGDASEAQGQGGANSDGLRDELARRVAAIRQGGNARASSGGP